MRKDEQVLDLVSIFVAHRSQLCQTAIKILGSPDKAEDVVQDAYLKIVEANAVFVIKQPVAYVFREKDIMYLRHLNYLKQFLSIVNN